MPTHCFELLHVCEQDYEAVLATGESAQLPPLAVPRSPVAIPSGTSSAEVGCLVAACDTSCSFAGALGAERSPTRACCMLSSGALRSYSASAAGSASTLVW